MAKRFLTRRELLAPTPVTDLDTRVHIASLLVHATPTACRSVKQLLNDVAGVELHDTEHVGKLALVLESADDASIGAIAARVQDVAGVISVSVVAHIVETERRLREECGNG